MRLDKFLKVSRLIKRRTIANEACDNGRISVNGRVVKASYEVKVGDHLEIAMGSRTVAVEFLPRADFFSSGQKFLLTSLDFHARISG